MTREEINRACEVLELDLLLADGLDEAFLGITRDDPPRAVYSYERVIDVLVEQGMTIAEADEYFEYNIAGAYVGEQTPIYIYSLEGT
jgi:hypothetical protein